MARRSSSRKTLEEYRRKRDFRKTPEPAGNGGGGTSKHRFVVHKHAASRLHYDFRLELGGTLKSWAVPKGPSFDPQEKRLAVHVEDHPLSYAGFEGVIPPGEYGAGAVIVWDRGTWEPAGDDDPAAAYAKGKLTFRLKGRKLRGGFALVRMRGRASGAGKNWLLIKERDAAARPLREFDVTAARPRSVVSHKTLEELERGGAARSRAGSSRKRTRRRAAPAAKRRSTGARRAR